MFEYSLCAGLTASGADAYLMHVTTTPSVSYIARADDFDCGIMITAKHGPTDGGCIVTLGMSDGKGEIVDLRLLVPDESAAKKMEKNFRLHAEEIYGELIELISGDKEPKQ